MIPPKSLVVAPASLKAVRGFIERHHYSKSENGVKVTQCFEVTSEGYGQVGAVLFGQMSTTAWRKFGAAEVEVLELRRLVLSDLPGHNSESYVVGWCLRWIKKNLPAVKCVVSYADPMHGHDGTIYRASNFEYLGTTPDDKGFTDTDTGKMYHSRALRTKYKGEFKPFVKKLRAKFQQGLLKETVLKGKHCFVYAIGRRKDDA